MDLRDTHIRLKVDNTTAVAYINAFSGTRSKLCSTVAKQLCDWCIDRNLWVNTCHVAGALNVVADRASRVFYDRTEWMLDPDVFQQLIDMFGSPDIDFFASRLVKEVARFVYWHPYPDVEPVDAFMLDGEILI